MTKYAITPQAFNALSSFIQVESGDTTYSLVPKYPERASRAKDCVFSEVIIYSPCLFPESASDTNMDVPKQIGKIIFQEELEATTAGSLIIAELQAEDLDVVNTVVDHAMSQLGIETYEPSQCTMTSTSTPIPLDSIPETSSSIDENSSLAQ